MASVAHIIRRRRQRKARRRAQQSRSRLWSLTTGLILILAVVLPVTIVLGGAAYLYLRATANLPTPEQTTAMDPIIGPTRLYDRDGQTLLFSVQDPLGNQRTWVTLDSLPPYIAQATLLAEDQNFLTVNHFDPISTLSRLWSYIIGGTPRVDSSLTARLVRNAILPRLASTGLDRRLLEIAVTSEINRRYSPESVLEWHLNTDYYGNDAYGIDAAARVYLGKAARDLTLDEAALLAAIPTAPQFNPIDDLTAAYGRQSDLLRRMLAGGMVTQSDYQAAANRVTPIVSDLAEKPDVAPEFSMYARRQAEEILDSLGMDGERLVSRGGLKITTTLDLDLYYQSECTLRAHLARLNNQPKVTTALNGQSCVSATYLQDLFADVSQSPPDSGSVIIVDVATGEIKAMVGDATHESYEPGPMLQPFVYFDGFRNDPWFTPATMVLDIPRPFPGPAEGLIYTPQNPDGEFRGPMNLRDAMGAGLVPPAAYVANTQSINSILVTARQMGLSGLNEDRYDLSLLERGGTISLLDLSYAYTVLASMGEMPGVAVTQDSPGLRQRDPVAVLKIEDSNGKVLWNYDDTQIALSRSKIFIPGLGYLINDILSDKPTRWPVLGENNVLDLTRPAAVENGLTSDHVDDWTIGYSPQLVIGVRLNRSDRLPMSMDPFGLNGAAHVWHAVMEYAHDRDNLPVKEWDRPDGIVDLIVCDKSGKLPGPDSQCPRHSEIFLDNVLPYQTDDNWVTVNVNSETGLLATVFTPPTLVVQRVYFVPPPEAKDWWTASRQPLPPTESDTLTAPQFMNSVQILQPSNFSYVGGVVDIRGSLDPTNMQYFQVAYGQGSNPDSWLAIGGQQTDYQSGVSMGMWDTTGLSGLYSLRLSVVQNDGTIQNAFAQVTVDNVAPTIELRAGEPGHVFTWPDESTVPVQAVAQDNLQIARVEFYVNGQLFGTDTDYPYGFDWPINVTGTVTFTATVFDSVGNQASASLDVEVKRGN